MKCREGEQRIYGYRELEEKERKGVDEHIRQCPACMLLFLEMQQQHSLVSNAATQKPIFKNSHRFAESVMQKIEPPKQVQQSNFLVRFIELTTVRYAMAGVSVLLTIVFFFELQPARHRPDENPVIASTEKVVRLETSSILKKVLDKKSETNPSKITSLYLCATIGDCDSPLMKIYSQKN